MDIDELEYKIQRGGWFSRLGSFSSRDEFVAIEFGAGWLAVTCKEKENV